MKPRRKAYCSRLEASVYQRAGQLAFLVQKKREIRRVFVTESSGEGFAGRTSGKARKIQRPEVTPPDSLFEIEVLKIVRKGDGYVKGIDDQIEQERLLEDLLPMFMETQAHDD